MTLEEKRTVLFVDDDRMNRLVMARFLKKCGGEAILRESAEHALADWDEAYRSYRGVIVDISMPGMNGMDFVNWILGRGAARERIAFWTATPLVLTPEFDDIVRLPKPVNGKDEIEQFLSDAM